MTNPISTICAAADIVADAGGENVKIREASVLGCCRVANVGMPPRMMHTGNQMKKRN